MIIPTRKPKLYLIFLKSQIEKASRDALIKIQKLVKPASLKDEIICEIIGVPAISISGLGISFVRGRNLVPNPAANIITEILDFDNILEWFYF